MLDRQSFDVIWLMLVDNVAFKIFKEKITARLIIVLLNMYEKPFAINNVYSMCVVYFI